MYAEDNVRTNCTYGVWQQARPTLIHEMISPLVTLAFVQHQHAIAPSRKLSLLSVLRHKLLIVVEPRWPSANISQALLPRAISDLFAFVAMALSGQMRRNSSSARTHRTMDVLMKLKCVPNCLRSSALETLANLLLQAFFRRRISHGSQHQKYLIVPNSVEESSRIWLSSLPVSLRQELLASVVKKLLCSSTNSCCPMSLPSMVASCVEVVYDEHFECLHLAEPLQWHRESRTKVLHRLHRSDTTLRQLHFNCYRAQVS